MEIAWLEDFLAVIDCGNFSRAVERRHITQSALSRRIKSLEDWVGAPLFQRTTHSVTLTSAGESFRLTAQETVRRLAAGRAEARELAQGKADMLRFASTNALSLGFFPAWLREMESTLPFPTNIQLMSNHMEACENLMLQGQAQFLLCHHHDTAATSLPPSQFLSLPIGADVLTPVSKGTADDNARPLYALPGTPQDPLPYLSSQPESGMGRIVSATQSASGRPLWLKPAFSSQMMKLLVTMALEGRGMAWCPLSLVGEDLAAGRLVRAGDESWDIPIQIVIVRSKTRLSPTAERFWSHIASAQS